MLFLQQPVLNQAIFCSHVTEMGAFLKWEAALQAPFEAVFSGQHSVKIVGTHLNLSGDGAEQRK